MSAQGAHKITAEFEAELCRYTGSPFAVAVDNCCNAIFLALKYYKIKLCADGDPSFYDTVVIPPNTYPGVPAIIKNAGYNVKFGYAGSNEHQKMYVPNLKGAYDLWPLTIVDSALRFTSDMYHPGYMYCLSFTGPYKHLKLGKGGAILTDNEHAYKWFKKARFSGRAECSYHDDDFDDNPVIGWNMYMMPEIAARGLALMPQFWNADGTAKRNDDLCMKYPDLSKFKIFQ